MYLRRSEARLRESQEKLFVRELKEEDAAAVSEMEHQLFSDGWSEKGIIETIKNSNTICLAAVKAEKLIGYMFVYFAAGEGEIAKIAVTKEKQRQGGSAPDDEGIGAYL